MNDLLKWSRASLAAHQVFFHALFAFHTSSGTPHASKLRALQRPRTIIADFAGIYRGHDITTLREVESVMLGHQEFHSLMDPRAGV